MDNILAIHSSLHPVINQQLFLYIFSLAHKNPLLDILFIFGATYLVFFAFFLILILAIKYPSKEKRVVLLILISLAVAWLMITIIRQFIFEPRPFVTLPIRPLIIDVSVPSFPSVHTTIMSAVAFSYFFFKSRFRKIFLMFFIIVGFSRIAVGVHYPLDILTGALVGLFSVLIGLKIERYFKV